MEEDQLQQNLIGRTTPSPEDSLTPPDSLFNSHNSQNQRAMNPKKRIISQLEEEMAQQRHPMPSPSNSQAPISPSSDALTPASVRPHSIPSSFLISNFFFLNLFVGFRSFRQKSDSLKRMHQEMRRVQSRRRKKPSRRRCECLSRSTAVAEV